MDATHESATAVTEESAATIESVVMQGDLAKLTPPQRVQYYGSVCESLGLNPLTRPFDYLSLNGKLVLYAKRDATDQIRASRKVTVSIVARERVEDLYIVTARAVLPDGRADESVGAVSVGGLRGEPLANAIMKAETKAKRRVTLSIAGLGWLDETEVSSVPDARRMDVDQETGEVLSALPTPPDASPAAPVGATPSPNQGAPTAGAPKLQASRAPGQDKPSSDAQRRACYAIAGKLGATPDQMKSLLRHLYGRDKLADLTSSQASGLIQHLQAVQEGRASLSAPEGSSGSPEGQNETADPLDHGRREILELAMRAGYDDESARAVASGVVDQETYQRARAELQAEVDKVPF